MVLGMNNKGGHHNDGQSRTPLFLFLAVAIVAACVAGALASVSAPPAITLAMILLIAAVGAVGGYLLYLQHSRQSTLLALNGWNSAVAAECSVVGEDASGSIIYVSDAGAAIPESIDAFIQDKTGGIWPEKIKALRETAAQAGSGSEILRHAGAVYEIQVRKTPLGLAWIVRDVTQGAGGNVLSELSDMHTVLDQSDVGLFALDEAGQILFANASLGERLGVNPDVLIRERRLLSDLLPGFDHNAARGQPEGQCNCQIKDAAGQTSDVSVVWKQMEAGGFAALSGIVRDAAGGSAHYNVLFEQAPVAILLLDRELRIVESNQTLRRMVDNTNPTGRLLADFITAGQQTAVLDRLRSALDGADSSAPVEASLVVDESIVVNMYVAPVSEAAGEVGVIVYLIDTTRQKSLEQQFVQSQKMQAVGQLAGGIAHDFNNLLTAMIGFCDLLLQRHRAGDQSFADIMQIKQNANRAARLVRQLLAFSRQQMLEPRPLNVTDALAELTNLLRRLLGEQVEMKMVHGRDLGMVKVDQGQFDQVIINLAVNARDAMAKGGTLRIETKNEQVLKPLQAHSEEILEGDYVTIAVSDSGMGISKENVERIFDPFFTTKDVGAGTGLGLSTVYGIIKQTGGYITVSSEGENKGATFKIFLKRLEPQEDAENVPAEARAARDVTGGGTVLLVEDEDPVRLFSARALRSKGYKVIEARNGELALDILGTEPLDLLITDMVMPKVDGATVIKAARKSTLELPVICISGYTDESVLSEVEALDNIHFLPKPFSLKQLAGKVKEALEN